MRYSYYEERLSGLEQYSGFFPRSYLPATYLANDNNPDLTSTQTLAIIDTLKEIQVGVGYDWAPVELGVSEIQIPSQLATYLGVAVNDTVVLKVTDNFD